MLGVFKRQEAAIGMLQNDTQDYLVKGKIDSAILKRSIRYAMQHKHDSEALRLSEQRFASYMLHMPVAAWMKDMEGRYVFANTEAERIFSAPLNTLLGKTDDEIFSPETARRFRENDLRVLNEDGYIRTTEVLHQADGIDHHSIVNKFAINGPDDKPLYVAGVALDITERIRMEAELEHYASFPLLHPIPIVEMDSDGKVTFCNRAAEETLGGVACTGSSNPFLPADLPDILRALHENGEQFFHRTVEVEKQVFDELIYFAPEFDSVRIYAMDVTERRRMEEALSRAHDELEHQVEERTASLVASNRQLHREIEERKRTEEELREQRTRAHALTSRLALAEEHERARIAGELHDHVGHRLLLAKLKLDALASSEEHNGSANEIAGLIGQSIQDIRTLTFQLRPPLLATAGLVAALEWLGEELDENYGLQVELITDGHPENLKFETSSLLFQVVRELLLNVAKHSGQNRAKFCLRREGGIIVFIVEDAGIGFNAGEIRAASGRNGGFGLFNVEQKIELLGGKFEVESARGRGARVTITVPLDGTE